MDCACGNEARYIDDSGQLTCATCPIKVGCDSIRLSDVPALLAWARRWLARQPQVASFRDSVTPISSPTYRDEVEELWGLVGRRPT